MGGEESGFDGSESEISGLVLRSLGVLEPCLGRMVEAVALIWNKS